MNSTIRLMLNRDLEGAANIPTLRKGQSLILKHYPPYMYAWPDAPLSTARAKAEADALRMIATDAHLIQVFSQMDVVVPQVIHFDEGEKVLWMEDLGNQKTLEDYLQPEYSDLGSRIGSIMAAIHLTTLPLPKSLPTEPPAGPNAILEHEERMRKLLETETDVDDLMDRLRMRDAPIIGLPHRDAPEDEVCFGSGDIWPTSFLLMDVSDGLRLGIIDWEFWGPMHPAAEIATLVARLYVAYVEKGMDPSNASPTGVVDAYLAAFRQSDHAELLGRASWTRRANAAWARVLLNAVYRAKTEGEERRIDDATTERLFQEALKSLRDEVANLLLTHLCGDLDQQNGR